MNQKTKQMAIVAMIAAVYTVVCVALAPLSYGNIQVRIAEALTMLPLVYAPSVLGVSLGCFLTNLIGVFTGANLLGVLDVFVGTFATAIAAVVTYRFKDMKVMGIPVISVLSPVIFNGVIIGAELGYVLFPETVLSGSIICGIEVAVGELISVIVGLILVKAMEKRNVFKDM